MAYDGSGRPRKVALTLGRRGWEQRWAIGIAVLAALVVALTLTVRNTDLLPGERSVSRWLFEQAGSPGEAVSKVLGVAIDTTGAPIMFAVMTPIVWRFWGRIAVVTFVLAGGLTAVASLIDMASRPRPTEFFAFGEVVYGKGGYPSGHVISTVLVFGILVFLLRRYAVPTRRRAALVWALAILTVAMGPSRLVEQAHWPADVTGGYLIGLTLLLSTIWMHDHTVPWLGQRFPRLHSLLTGDSPPGPGEGASDQAAGL